VHHSVLHGYRSVGTAFLARQALKVHAVSTVDKVEAPQATKSGQKTAVVVGAGVGGLTMAGRLARAGFKVNCVLLSYALPLPKLSTQLVFSVKLVAARSGTMYIRSKWAVGTAAYR
jgi:hypothetical protein